MIDKNPLNATDLRHALAEATRHLQTELAEAARLATEYQDGPLKSEETGHYTGLRMALAVLHLFTKGEFGVDGEAMPHRPLEPGERADP